MNNEIKISRKDLIHKLSGITDDNVSIGNVAINRHKLLSVLRLQPEDGDDMLTITRRRVSWHDKYKTQTHWGDGSWIVSKVKNEPCIQISSNHTVMRFLNRPKVKAGAEPEITPLNLNSNTIQSKLSGTLLDTQELIEAINFVIPCIGNEPHREVLQCVLFDSNKDAISLVTADGFRLTSAKITARGIRKGKVLIHAKDITKLTALLKSIKPIGKGKAKLYPQVYVKYGRKYITFSTAGDSIKLDKQTWIFPNYKPLIPKDGTKIKFISRDLLAATRALSHIAKDGSGIIRLQFQRRKPHGKILLSANGWDGDNKSTAECDAIVPASRKVAINTKYLMDLLRLCPNEIVIVRVKHHTNPVVFDIDTNKQAVIMPMFVQW